METQTNVTAPELSLPANGSPMIPASNATPAATPAAEPSTPAPKKEVFFAGRKFDSEADALAYASGLAPSPAAAPAVISEELTPGKLIFEDPEAAFRIAQEQVINRIEQKYTAVEQHKKTWEGFYEKHSDLKGHRAMVDGLLATRPDIAKMPIEQGLETLARESRSMIASIRGTSGTPERMNANGATTANPSPVPGVTTVVQTTKPTTFVEEMKAMRASRKKVV